MESRLLMKMIRMITMIASQEEDIVQFANSQDITKGLVKIKQINIISIIMDMSEFVIIFIFCVIICSCCIHFSPTLLICLIKWFYSLQDKIEFLKHQISLKKRVHCVIIHNIPVATETDRVQHTVCRVVPDAVVIR